MKKNHCLLASVFLFSGIIYGLEPLTPFGDIRWDDNLLDVILKVNMIPGIEKFSIVKGIGEIDLGLISSKEDVKKIFRNFYQSTWNSKNFKLPYKIGFQKKGSKIRIYDTFYETLKVSPIMIQQIPFEMEIRFKVSPGLPLVNQKKLIALDQKVFLSMHIDEITLRTHSNLLPDHYEGLHEALEKKYKKYHEGQEKKIQEKMKRTRNYMLSLATGTWESERIRTILRDEDGDEVEIILTPNYCKISYNSISYVNRLDEEFDTFLKKREEKKFGTKKDLTAGL